MLIRETIINFYKRYETTFLLIMKMFAGIIIFSVINNIGFERSEFSRFYKPPLAMPYTFLMGMLFAVIPYTLSYLMIIVTIVVQLTVSTEVAAVVCMFLLCVLVFYARLAPKESILILLTVFASFMHIPYVVPLLAGLYFSYTSIIPITIGIFIVEFIPVVKSLVTSARTAGLNVMDMPGTFAELYVAIMNSLDTNQQWVFYSFIFAMAIVVVRVVSRLAIDYARDMAIALGGLLIIVSMLIVVIVADLDIGIFTMILLTILSTGLVWVIHFFDMVLDYQRVERVQFEDEENYYYVKVIPKVILTRRKRVVRRIRPQSDEE